ncbi:arylsulfatase, partial [Sphingobium sp.]|uniref:arylsulfatase n=1 Tax=Sphingobium sp. TaxID=1912891 RepID=UPI0035C66D71
QDVRGYVDRCPHMGLPLAMRGVRCTGFHSAPACSPTRAMLLTGTDPHIAGIGTMLEVADPSFTGAPGYEGYLNGRVVTVSETLQAAGWHTMMSGKWHLGDTDGSRPHARGFDRSFAMMPAGGSHYAGAGVNSFSTVDAVYREDGALVTSLPEDYYSSDYFATRLIDFLGDRPRDRPFFAYLPFSAPHWPLHAPRGDVDRYRGRYDAGPEALRAERLAAMRANGLCPADAPVHPFAGGTPWEEIPEEDRAWSARTMEVYAAMVSRMDHAVGRVIDHLRASGDLDDTIILFLSDNGAEGAMVEAMPIVGPIIAAQIDRHFDNSIDNLGTPTSCCWYGPRWAQAATAPCRLHKSFTTEGGIRVPFFACGPGVAGDGRISHAFATAMDIPATLLDWAGVAHPARRHGRDVEPMRGASLARHLRGEADAVHGPHVETGWELFGRRAIRRGPWKALWIREPEGAGRWQLYDVERDPGETQDRADDEPQLLRELIGAWDRYAASCGVVDGPVSLFETHGP